jgi:2-amino-4-hydroxy-6-hydroxymethyldihydropteridine diphosphokinase
MILVAIGANLPGPAGATPLQTCVEAVQALGQLPGLQLHSVSRWYETEPVPRSDQPNYVNGVARLQRMPGTVISPEVLLASLHSIEARYGRRRSEPNAARTLDLDLIDLDGLVRESPDPILPHPRTQQRAFVLLPLLDVAPDWVHPANGRTGLELLDAVDRSGIRMLPE